MDEWMTDQEAADWLRLPADVVRQAVGAGDLPGIVVGGHTRVSRSGVINRVGPAPTPRVEVSTPATVAFLPEPLGLQWVEQLTPSSAFDYAWPKAVEAYPSAWTGSIRLLGEPIKVRVGLSAPREDGHSRLTVFFNNYPTVEFAPASNGKAYASVVKPDGKKTLHVGDAVPLLYQRVPLASYQEITGQVGSGRPKGLALVISPDDLRSAVHHAAARRLGKRGGPLEEAAGRDPQLALTMAAVRFGQALGYGLGKQLFG